MYAKWALLDSLELIKGVKLEKSAKAESNMLEQSLFQGDNNLGNQVIGWFATLPCFLHLYLIAVSVFIWRTKTLQTWFLQLSPAVW